MRKRIIIRILLLSLSCVIAIFGAGAVAVRHSSRKTAKEQLSTEANLIQNCLATDNSIAWSEHFNGNIKMILYTSDGEPIDSEKAEPYAEIPLVTDSLPTFEEYYSDTQNCRLFVYTTTVLTSTGDTNILRLVCPNTTMTEFIRIAVPLLLVMLAFAVGGSVLLAVMISKKFSGRMEEIAEGLRSLEHGKYLPIHTDRHESEFDSLIWEMNELNRRTQTVMEAQSHEREKLSTVLDIVAQGIVALDSAFRVVLANKSALKIFGADEKNIGSSIFTFLTDETFCRKLNELSGDGSFEYRYGERELVVTIRAITDHALAREIAQIVIVTDVTDARDIAREKSDFFANASHELKTPITVTLGLSELILAKDGIDDGIRLQIDRIHKEASRMSQLITDMLRLSRLEQHPDSNREPVDVRAIADEVVAELNSRIHEKNLAVTVSGNGTVSATPERIYELITNLCSNAVNYNVDGGQLDVSVCENVGETVLVVKDTGIGIPKEHLPRVCERFYRVDKSRSKKTGGTGLGLAIVKHICVLYTADLKIESTVGVGTCVTVTFPKNEK